MKIQHISTERINIPASKSHSSCYSYIVSMWVVFLVLIWIWESIFFCFPILWMFYDKIKKVIIRLPQLLTHTHTHSYTQQTDAYTHSAVRSNITYHLNYIVWKINDRNQRKKNNNNKLKEEWDSRYKSIYPTRSYTKSEERKAKQNMNEKGERKKNPTVFLINFKKWKFYVPWIVIIIIIISYADFVLFSVVWNTFIFVLVPVSIRFTCLNARRLLSTLLIHHTYI